jgi:putative heme-binding domain-containing protein
LAKLKSEELIKLLSHPNDWYARTARRILADRRDPEVIFPLRTLVMESKDENLQLQAFWALYVSGGLSEAFAEKLLKHPNPDVRRWSVRAIGDDQMVGEALGDAIYEFSKLERNPSVLSQLCCSCTIIESFRAMAVLENLLMSSVDAKDPHLSMLVWWAVEKHSFAGGGFAAAVFSTHRQWKSNSAREQIASRLIRKYASSPSKTSWACCYCVLANCRTDAERKTMLHAIDLGMREGRYERDWQIRDDVRHLLIDLWKNMPDDTSLIRILARANEPVALKRAAEIIRDSKIAPDTRLQIISIVSEIKKDELIDALLPLVGGDESITIQTAALSQLQQFDALHLATKVLEVYQILAPTVKPSTRSALLSRQSWAALTLQRIDEGKFPAKDFTLDELRAVALHNDPKLDALVRKHWGNIQPATPGEKLAEVRRFNNDLRAGGGDPIKGKLHFTQHCAACHQLFGEGTKLGPDLTTANRQDRDYLLVSIVDPSAIIRKEYLGYNIDTHDGRRLSGMVVEQSPEKIVLADVKNQRTEVMRNQIEAIRESPLSLMPENIIKELKPQELRDLFAYLQSKSPK